MLRKNRIVLFITLFSLTFFIFSSSTILANILTLETEAEAKSIVSASYIYHGEKISGIQIKEATNEQFLLKETNPIYLTFDDGPTNHTMAILDILASYEIPSTFFMLSTNIKKKPEIVKAIAESGHTLGCHGVTHQVSAFYANPTSPLEEMEACERDIQNITGEEVHMVRVPFGSFPHLSQVQKTALENAQFTLWDWNVDSMDWKVASANEMVETVLHQVNSLKEKEITPVLLFHDKSITVDALPKIIEGLQGGGYEFLSITPDDKPLQFKLKK